MKPGVRISIVISYRSWLTNHRVQFHYKERANAQITDYALCYKHLQTVIVITKSIYICNGLLNQPSQLISQYFTRQLVQVSLFTNMLPLQIFSYSNWLVRLNFT